MGVTIELGATTVDLDEGWVERAGVRDPLGPRELAVLKTLAARPDERVSREELVAAVWGVEPVGARACDRVVYRLRAKLEADPNTPEFLLTEHGAGYRLRLRAPAPSTAPLAARSTGVAVHDRVLDLDRARIDGPDGPVSLTGNEQAVLRLRLDADGEPNDAGGGAPVREMTKAWLTSQSALYVAASAAVHQVPLVRALAARVGLLAGPLGENVPPTPTEVDAAAART
ncbi:MAG: winged helix-turn-helix domain-containing protein, partial [Myxococcota bacterium]